MGNQLSSRRVYPDLKPSAPIVTLTERAPSPQRQVQQQQQQQHGDSDTVTEEIKLHWKPPKQCKKSAILGYKIEMWDLVSHTWVEVTVSSNPMPQAVLSNILSGMLYQFRVTALTSHGQGEPSDPSEAFIVDIPDVNIAPYWVNTLPGQLTLPLHGELVLRAEALGTPKPSIHWYKDDEEIFIDEGVHISEMALGCELRVENLQLSDAGLVRCSAINTIGKAVAETMVEIYAKPEFLFPPREAITFREDELIRLKFPLTAIPKPILGLRFDGLDVEGAETPTGLVKFKENHVLFTLHTAHRSHQGTWTIRAENCHGASEMSFSLQLEEPPGCPSAPLAELHDDSVTLRWTPADMQLEEGDTPIYHVEYYRDQWQLWLKGMTSALPSCVLTDLVPGSYYKFRIRVHTRFGLSEPSPESEMVLIGTPPEDELFGLPGGNYPRANGSLVSGPSRPMAGPGQRHSSLMSLERSKCRTPPALHMHSRSPQPNMLGPPEVDSDPFSRRVQGRQFSLEREVYYNRKDGERREVVTYNRKKPSVGSQGLASKAGMSQEEIAVYKKSMTDLCKMLTKVSQQNISRKNEARKIYAASEEEVEQEILLGQDLMKDKPVSDNVDAVPEEDQLEDDDVDDYESELELVAQAEEDSEVTTAGEDNFSLSEKEKSSSGRPSLPRHHRILGQGAGSGGVSFSGRARHKSKLTSQQRRRRFQKEAFRSLDDDGGARSATALDKHGNEAGSGSCDIPKHFRSATDLVYSREEASRSLSDMCLRISSLQSLLRSSMYDLHSEVPSSLTKTMPSGQKRKRLLETHL